MLDQAPLQLDRGGIKEREDGQRGGGGRLLEVGDYFKHFGLRRRLFEGRLFIRGLFVSESWLSIIILSHSNWPEDYIMVRKGRAGSPIGGGVAIIFRNNWKVKALNVTDRLEFES